MIELARRSNINTVRAQLYTVPASETGPGGDVLLVKRFDRSLMPTHARDSSVGQAQARSWTRDAYVSARTVLISDGGGYQSSFTGSYAKLARDLQRWSANATQDRLELYRRMVFNCCVSNTDDHDRNHGFLAREDGRGFDLAPAFDMVPRLHGTRRRYQGMIIGDHGAETTIENLLSAAGAFDLDQRQAQEIIEEIQTQVLDHWSVCLQEQGLDERSQAVLAPCFEPLAASFEDLVRHRPVERW